MPKEDTQAEALAISERVKKLMERHGVPKRSQASTLSNVLNLSFSAASRKMKGQLPWDIQQLKAIATHFGEGASVLVEPEVDSEDGAKTRAHPATFMIDNMPYPCTAWIGDEVTRDSAGAFVARPVRDSWFVYPTGKAPEGRMFDVVLIEIRPEQPAIKRPTIAILDDDRRHHSADSLAEALNAAGFDAIAFTNADDLLRSMETTVYDAFVLDWILGPGLTVEPIIDAIRASANPSRDAVIQILTGKLKDGTASEEDITRVSRDRRCTCIEKPIRPALLAEGINTAIGSRRST